MKLVQLNAWGGKLEFQILKFIKNESPDIVCLQEIFSFNNKDGTGQFATIELIQQQAKLPFVAFGPVFSYNYMHEKAHFGNAILSRYPIKRSDTIFTHLAHKSDFIWGKHSVNIRNFVHAELDIPGKDCHILTHHGYWISEHKDGNDETHKQMRQIAEYIDSLGGPVILTGDFNLQPNSKSLGTLNKKLLNLPMKYGLETTRTPLTTKTEVCDYIFVNQQVEVEEFTASDEVISDHQALILEFDI